VIEEALGYLLTFLALVLAGLAVPVILVGLFCKAINIICYLRGDDRGY
jgi:hypothetical protein